MMLLSFFFSSRRRHTRSLCDWSSDVCSSDLAGRALGGGRRGGRGGGRGRVGGAARQQQAAQADHGGCAEVDQRPGRSEERRVGKEGRSGWSPYAYIKKIRGDVVNCRSLTERT